MRFGFIQTESQVRGGARLIIVFCNCLAICLSLGGHRHVRRAEAAGRGAGR